MVVSFFLQLNRWLTFKCLNINQMSVTFTCDKETFKFSVGSTVGAHDPHSKEEMVHDKNKHKNTVSR